MKTLIATKDWPSPARHSTRGDSKRAVSETSASADTSIKTNTKPSTARSCRLSSDQNGMAEFYLDAPTAGAVKLIADFTNWEKHPLELSADASGVWHATVMLPPGRYGYRFLVDGQWHDDPNCTQSEANPFGTFNAIIEVI